MIKTTSKVGLAALLLCGGKSGGSALRIFAGL